MIINKIIFKNYRCFVDGEIIFKSDKPINMVLGYNGTGKTELLYAVWYVLHGFDFSTLKSKESAPYSINTLVYNRLQSDPTHYHDKSEVELQFTREHEEKKIRYVIRRIEKYEKGRKNSTEEYVELYSYVNGNKSALITDQKKIEEIIETIVPEKVLSGIMFDGERMKNLSSEDENSIKAIEGTIQDVTNQRLFVALTNDFEELHRKYIKERRNTGKKYTMGDQDELETKLFENRNELNKLKKDLSKVDAEIPDLEKKINNLSNQLIGYDETKSLETKREKYHLEKNNIQKEIETAKKSLQDKEFKNSSSAISTSLLDEVESLIDKNKLPKRLNSEAVESIIKEKKCICGRPHTNETINQLKKLKEQLPPENLNAVIGEWVDNIRSRSESKLDEMKDAMESLKSKQNRITELKRQINLISTKITSFDNVSLKALEKEKVNLELKIDDYRDKKITLEKRIKTVKTEIELLDKKIKNITIKNKELTKIQNKISFVKKSLNLIKRIKDINTSRALVRINEFMQTAYEEISEEYGKGRRVYITQFIKQKYKLIAYYEKALNEKMKSKELGHLQKKYKELDFTDDNQKREAMILEVAENNSTGQSKIMTMSFIKAILDYSSKQKNNEFETTKQYPLLLDAPFSELSGENLTQSAKNLHLFNEQTILLIDPDTYILLKPYFKGHIATVNELIKGDGESKSTIRSLQNEIS